MPYSPDPVSPSVRGCMAAHRHRNMTRFALVGLSRAVGVDGIIGSILEPHTSSISSMQLDIFADSRDVMLRNDVVSALQRYDARETQQSLKRLSDDYPDDDSVPQLTVLADALDRRSAAAFSGHSAAAEARCALVEQTTPAALRMFGERAGTQWLVPMWRELAQRASLLPFRANSIDTHAAALWLQAGAWSAARDAVLTIESWRRIPAPVMWMADALYRLDSLETTWPLLAELAWLAPDRFARLVDRLGDKSLDSLLKKFHAGFEGAGDGADIAWFPAWALIEKPALARLLGATQPSTRSSPERAMRLLLELLSLERQGRHFELLECRKKLQGLHASLYACYMSTR
jgi:hypothetical protein